MVKKSIKKPNKKRRRIDNDDDHHDALLLRQSLELCKQGKNKEMYDVLMQIKDKCRKVYDMICLYRLRHADIYDIDETCEILKTAGYTCRLNDHILNYNIDNPQLPRKSSDYAWAFNDIFPPHVLTQLQDAFDYKRQNENFWIENDYYDDNRGFFSFTHPLNHLSSSFMDRLVEYIHTFLRVHAIIPESESPVNYAEWWCHCRASGNGHQLHFDSADEGRGNVRHPVCTAILYVSSTENASPTLITDQTRASSKLAENGWLAYPQVNRMVVLDGKYLHGVVPSHSYTNTNERRITIMISYWKQNEMLSPFPPPAAAAASWTRRLLTVTDKWWSDDAIRTKAKQVVLQHVSPVWVPLTSSSSTTTTTYNLLLPHYSQCFQGL